MAFKHTLDHKAPHLFTTRGAPPYARFLERYLCKEGARRDALVLLVDDVNRILAPPRLRADVTGRLKSPRSTWRKMRRYGIDLDDVHDLLGLRILVGREGECHLALAAIVEHWEGQCGRLRDYITRPKSNGYQSIHLCVAPTNSPRFEIQIRTEAMHRRCEHGKASHARYKRALIASRHPTPSQPLPAS